MEIELTFSLLAFCVTAFVVAGFIDAIAGGGGLITTPCLLIAGLPPHMVLGTNKFAVMLGSLSALISYLRNHLVELRIAPLGFAMAFAGSAFGAWIALQIDSSALGKVIIMMLPIGFMLLLCAGKSRDNGGALPERHLWLKVILLSFAIGFYDGFFGPATGSFFIIALNLLLNMNLVRASGTAKVLNLASNLGALALFSFGGVVIYALAIPCAFASIAGNLLGVRMAVRVGARAVRLFLYVMLTLLIITLTYRFFIAS